MKLWGHSENAVKTYLWMAICAYMIVAPLKLQIRSSYSVYEMMQTLEISAFSKTPVNEIFSRKQINQNVKEQLTLFSVNQLLTHQ
jgi:ABC-type bacteriocin/lantibiotic exporter with double-glycine peptidase domain